MNSLPRKDQSDERDEPLASEDEVEHEDDTVDVELWKKKLVKWKEEELIRKAEEEERMRELERQRQEWEEKRRKYEEEQRIYQEHLALEQMRREEELRRQMENAQGLEDMEEGKESWDDENYDEDGNPIEDNYNDGLMDDPNLVCNEYGEPVEMVTVPGMFSDFGNYKTSVDILSTAFQSVKGQAMAADWDDWGETEEMETSLLASSHIVEEPEVAQYSSMVSHSVTSYSCDSLSASAASHSVNRTQAVSDPVIEIEVTEEQCIASLVTHKVSTRRTSDSINVRSIECNLQHLASVSETIQEDHEQIIAADGDRITQVDGINDDSSDEDMEQDDEDEHRVPEAGMPQGENINYQESSDSIMSVDDETVGQAENNQRDDKSDSDTEEDREYQGEERDDSGEDDVDSGDSRNLNDNNEISNEAEESDNYDRHGDASDNYASDFDDVVNERIYSEDESRHSDDESSLSNGGYDQDNVRDPDTKDDAPEVQSDSDIEEVEEIEEVKDTRRNPYEDDENEGDKEIKFEDEDEVERSSESEHSESEFEEEDISEDVPVRQPCILVFDSLGGRKDRQARLCAVLRDYLTMEFQEKYPGQKREFSTRTMPGCAPKVPQQPNLTDCGIYVCHNVETFFKKPIDDYTLPITSLKNWFPGSEPRGKRGDVASLIRRLATEQNQDKLERLIWPELVFREPERQRLESGTERRRSYDESDRDEDYDISDEEYYSEEDRDDRGHKRYRSDNSSDEDRSPQRRKRDESEGEDAFDTDAVYGARADRSSLRKLPPGISVSRSSESVVPGTTRDFFQSLRQDYPTPLRKLPPGISISKQTAPSSPSPPPRRPPPLARPAPLTPEAPLLQEMTSPRAYRQGFRQVTFTSGSSDDGDTSKVRMKSLDDDGDDNNEIFDLDTPVHTRTYLSPNSFRSLQEQQQYWASVRAEACMSVTLDTSLSVEAEPTICSSMVSHQAAHYVLNSCLSSMVAHSVTKPDDEARSDQDALPQLDGMDDFDSEDEIQVEAAESVAVNEDVAHQAEEIPLALNLTSEDINQPVEMGEESVMLSEEFSMPETTTEHGPRPEVMAESDFSRNVFVGEIPHEYTLENVTQSGNLPTEVAVENMEQLVPGDEVGLDNHALLTEESTVEEEYNLVPEAQLVDLHTTEIHFGDFANAEEEGVGNIEAFGDRVENVDIEEDIANAEEEEQVNVEEFGELVENVDREEGANAQEEEKGNVEELGEHVENEDIEDGAQSEDLNDFEEEYASDDEEDSRDPQNDYERTAHVDSYQPPQKRARVSSDDEVVLDSDEDDVPAAPQAPRQQTYAPRGKLRPKDFGLNNHIVTIYLYIEHIPQQIDCNI